MRNWFESLQMRERVFVGVGGVVVVVGLLYGLAWVPFQKHYRELSSSVDNWQASLVELRPLQGLASSAAAKSSKPAAVAEQTPVVIVDTTLRAKGLQSSLKRSQPTSNGIRVDFEDVAFDDLVVWLGDVGTQYGMYVQAATVSDAERAGPGRVNATLTLERVL